MLSCPYEAAKARLVLREMADQLSLELVEKGLVTDQVVLTVGYDIENLTDPARRTAYSGPVEQDRYGRRVPKAAHGAQKLDAPSSSTRRIMEAASALFDRIVDGGLLVRRMYLVAAHIVPEDEAQPEEMEQLDLFTDLATEDARREAELASLDQRFRLLLEHLGERPEVRLTRFRPDERKSGGVYETVSGIVKQIDLIARRIRLLDETDIPMDDVLTLDGALFDVLD